MGDGVYMKYYTKAKGNSEKPRVNDGVTFEVAQYLGDSLIFTTAGGEPIKTILNEPDFVGDVADALTLMHVGDSVGIVTVADSMFASMEEIPEEAKGKLIYYDLKLLSITPYEKLQADHKRVVDSLQLNERRLLDSCVNKLNGKTTESGLIILSRKGGTGVPVKLGDYASIDFTMTDMNGDTLLSSVNAGPMDVQIGESSLCSGFDKGLGMMSKGESMSFVIPSSLGFDSTGYEDVILPYSPLLFSVKVNDVMASDVYQKLQAKLKAELKARESHVIAKYVKDNGIKETPTASGLYIIWNKKGEGNVAKWGDKVSMNYVISALDGTKLESSYEQGSPMTFTIGQDEMMPAIQEAVMQMNVGSKVRLIVPSELGFGEQGIDPRILPPGTPLLFDVEVMSIN